MTYCIKYVKLAMSKGTPPLERRLTTMTFIDFASYEETTYIDVKAEMAYINEQLEKEGD